MAASIKENVSRKEPWLSQPQAARLLGRHRQTVASMAARGELKSRKVAGRLFIARASVDALLETAGDESRAA